MVYMKDFKEVVKLKIVPTTFVFHCTLCNQEIIDYDRHLGLIKMNEHVLTRHSREVQSLDKEDLYSRKPTVVLDSF
jgi:hypothetical protein